MSSAGIPAVPRHPSAEQDPRAAALPRISVLTPCLNGARYIVEAIESLRRQDYPDLEHIVLDGGSTDGTLALLARYRQRRDQRA